MKWEGGGKKKMSGTRATKVVNVRGKKKKQKKKEKKRSGK